MFKGPKRSSDQIFTFTNALTSRHQDLQNLKFSCLYVFPFAHKVVPQFGPFFRAFKALKVLKGPQIKFSNRPMHWPYNRDLQNLKFLCLYLLPFFSFCARVKIGQKIDFKNGLKGQKGSVGCLIWGWLPPP